MPLPGSRDAEGVEGAGAASRGDAGRGESGDGDAAGRAGSLAATKAKYEPSMTCLADVFRNPVERPLATLTAAVVLGALAYQAVSLGAENPAAGGVVALAGAGAYAVARAAWRVENDYVATELARMEFDPARPDPAVSPDDAGAERSAD